MLNSYIVHDRISLLLSKISSNVGFQMKNLKGCWLSASVPTDKPTLKNKLEILGYFRLLSYIYFSDKKKKDDKKLLEKE
jgi:hypothetical protein